MAFLVTASKALVAAKAAVPDTAAPLVLVGVVRLDMAVTMLLVWLASAACEFTNSLQMAITHAQVLLIIAVLMCCPQIAEGVFTCATAAKHCAFVQTGVCCFATALFRE